MVLTSCLTSAIRFMMLFLVAFLDQELILYRYSSCSCWSNLQLFKKAQVFAVSNQIRMKFSRIVPPVNTHQLAEPDVWLVVIISQWWLCCHFIQESVVLPPSEWKWSICCAVCTYAAVCLSSRSIVHSFVQFIELIDAVSPLLPSRCAGCRWCQGLWRDNYDHGGVLAIKLLLVFAELTSVDAGMFYFHYYWYQA